MIYGRNTNKSQTYRAPEQFDVIQNNVPAAARRDLAEIGKMLNQIAIGVGFREDLRHLMPLNEYVMSASLRLSQWMESQGEVRLLG